MAYVVSNQRTGQQLAACVDRRRADRLTFGFEQYSVRGDLGARSYYWFLGRLPMGAEHPYDTGAKRLLEVERDRLIDGCTRNAADRTDD